MDMGDKQMARIIEPFNSNVYSEDKKLLALEVLSNQIYNLHMDLAQWEKERRESKEEDCEELCEHIKKGILDALLEGRHE